MGEYLPDDLKPADAPGAYLPEGTSAASEKETVIRKDPEPTNVFNQTIYTTPPPSEEENRRMYALERAGEFHPGSGSTKIVEFAKQYEAYLKGETSA